MIKKLRKQFKQDPSRPNYKPEPPRKKKRYQYGPVPGVAPGTTFVNRQACADAGVHRVILQGIHGSNTGAYSVCLSGTYEDDRDDGESFIYTGTGGKEDAFSSSSKQVEDQNFQNANKSLKMSAHLIQPVRVVRGSNKKSKWAPANGYRYDGLYYVVKAYYARGISGHKVCKFAFQRLPGQPPLPVNPAFEDNDTDSEVSL